MKPTSAPAACPQIKPDHVFIDGVFSVLVDAEKKSFATILAKYQTTIVSINEVQQEASNLKDDSLKSLVDASNKFGNELARNLGLPIDFNPSDVLTGAGVPADLWACIKDIVAYWNQQAEANQDLIQTEYDNLITTVNDA